MGRVGEPVGRAGDTERWLGVIVGRVGEPVGRAGDTVCCAGVTVGGVGEPVDEQEILYAGQE